MVKIRREKGNTTWLLESDSLSGRLGELAVVFRHHSRQSDNERMDSRFMAETLSLQAEALAKVARAQEEEIQRLRHVEEALAELRAAFNRLAEEINPTARKALDKPAQRPPSAIGK
jgi:DNA anti-recombination protein RmuC